jgi:hypothetical protein
MYEKKERQLYSMTSDGRMSLSTQRIWHFVHGQTAYMYDNCIISIVVISLKTK